MSNNGNKQSCTHFAEIVSYIYDELTVDQRVGFESHLSDCEICRDEFAGISNARFAVYEWQREEFAPLASPTILIPYEAATVGRGIVATIRGWA